MNKRGSVILHILVTGVVVALMAALLLRMTILRHLVTARSHRSTQMVRYDESVLAQLNSVWSSGLMCTSFGTYTCSGATAGFCGCTCTSPGMPSIVTSPSGPVPCRVVIPSSDMMPAP